MSRHFYPTQTKDAVPVTVTCGWDRPLQGFFLTITSQGQHSGNLFCNIRDRPEQPHPPTFEPFLEPLAELGIELPDSLLREIEADSAANAGNKIVDHSNGVRQALH